MALYILVPRWPSFEYDTDTPLRATGNDAVFKAGVFSFSASLATSISTKDTFLPLAFSTFRVTVNDVETGKIIATVRARSIAAADEAGRLSVRRHAACPSPRARCRAALILLHGRQLHRPDVRSHVRCRASLSGRAFADRVQCSHIYPTVTRPTLTVGVTLTDSIRGLSGSRSLGSQLPPVDCVRLRCCRVGADGPQPFQLPSTAG